MPRVNCSGLFFWGSSFGRCAACGSSPGGAMPGKRFPGIFFRGLPHPIWMIFATLGTPWLSMRKSM